LEVHVESRWSDKNVAYGGAPRHRLLMHRLQNAEFTNGRVQAAGRRKAADARKAEASLPPNTTLESMASSCPAISVTPVPE